MDQLLTKEEILGGLPAGRARTTLFLIESKTAHLMVRARQAMDVHLTEEGERRRDLAFVEAFALGRDPPLHPKIQDLERFAPQWAHLVPDNVRLRAATARALGAKYPVSYRWVPEIRRALGLDTEVVQSAYHSQYGESLATIYTSQQTLAERLRWAQSAIASRLESLPPFWTAFALTLTETVGVGILALPVALARVGPGAGIVLLVVLGLVNVLTIAAMAESITRTGSVRYGNAFFGCVVGEYLGGLGSLVSTLANIILNATSLLAYFIGFAQVMGGVTRLPVELWAGVLFVICLYFLTRGSLSSTITSALVIGGINLMLVLILSFLALMRLQLENLSSAAGPLIEGQFWDPQVLGLIFGVVLLAYCGHESVGTCGRIVLRRDPGGRSLLRGTVAAELVAMVLYCLWVVAIQGALAPEKLVSYQGTALEPLAAVVGPSAHVLGTIYAILAIAMVSVHVALALFNTVRERLPEVTEASHAAMGSLIIRGHFLWCLLPVLLIFAAAEWLLLGHNESFTGVMNFGGVVGASIFAGIFPVLLLAASRRKGDLLPAVVYRLMGHPLLLGAVYLLFLAGVWIHGLVIWQNPLERLAAVVCGLLVVIMTLLTLKKGAFHRRLVVQFRKNRGDEEAIFTVVAGGEAAMADVVATSAQGDVAYHAASSQVLDAASLRRLTFQISDISVPEVKVWAHQVELEGTSTPLPARLTLSTAGGERRACQDLDAGPVLVPWSGEDGRVDLAFRSFSPSRSSGPRGSRSAGEWPAEPPDASMHKETEL
jgi:amino acid transporter